MTSEQLQHARAERWRQSSNPILTAEDAQAWMDGIGFCLFLPRRAHFLVPAPSFVEAVMGAPTDAPARGAVESASALLHRLTGSAGGDGAVVPLNLFGLAASSGNGALGASDQPDFLATRATLPYVFSLIGGRNWKSGPGTKASPLVLEIWKQLESAGAQTAGEIQAALGRELTEAAVLRGLMELWNGLRAIPVYDGAAARDGETTRWELTQARFAAEMTASQKIAQTTALSALVSLYLEAVVAASSEEIETFLSPLTSRSRVREVVNGLSATRQLGLISVGAQPLMHVAGSLPEFEEAEPMEVERQAPERRAPFEKRSGFPHEEAARPREGGERGRGGPRPERSGFGRPEAERFAARGEGSGSKPARSYRKPEGRRSGNASRKAAGQGNEEPGNAGPGNRERKPFGKKPFERASRPAGSRPFHRGPASTGGGGNYPPKRFGKNNAKPWQERGGSAARNEGERPPRERGEQRSSGFGGAEKSGEKRYGGPKKFGGAKFGGPKRFGGPKFGSRSDPGAGSRPYSPRPSGSRPYSRPARAERSASSGGFKRERPGEKRPFFRERPAREGGSRGSGFKPRTGEGARPARHAGGWKPRPAGGGFQKGGGRGFGKFGKPGFKSGKPFESSGKPGFKSEGGAGYKSSRKPGFKRAGYGKAAPSGRSGKPFENSGKPFGKSGKSFGKPRRPSGKSSRPSGPVGKPGSGEPRRGGFKPPFRKRKKDGDGGGE